MKGISFVVGKNLHEPNSPSNVRAKIRCSSTAGTRIFVTSKRWWSIISFDLFDTKAKLLPSTMRSSSRVLRLLRVQQSSVKFKGTSESLEPCVMHALIAEHMFTPNLDAHTGDDAIIDTFTQEDHRHVHPRGFGPLCALENCGEQDDDGSKEG